MRRALNPSGVVLVNLLASPEGVASRFYQALYATFATAFAEVHAYAVHDPADRRQWQNLMLTALTGPPPATRPDDPVLQSLLANALPPPATTLAPFTDEFAPVDRYLGVTAP
jgi:hypothetical protein